MTGKKWMAIVALAALSVASVGQQFIEHKGRQVDKKSVMSVKRHLKALKTAAGGDQKTEERDVSRRTGTDSKHKEMEEAGTDFWEAWLEYVKKRAYPNDRFDDEAIYRAIEHRSAMPGERIGISRNGTAGLNGNWQELGPFNLDVPYRTYYGIRPTTGRVNTIAVDPTNGNTIYIGACNGGVWKTTDGGVNWTPLSDGWEHLAISRIVIDPTNPNTVYVGTGDFHAGDGFTQGLMKSTNGGASWVNLGRAEFGNRCVSGIIVDPETPSTVTVSTGGPGSGDYGQVWRSTNGGQTWSVSLSTATRWANVVCSALENGSNRYYYTIGNGTGGGNIWRSSDRGQTWTRLTSPLTNSVQYVEITVSPTNPNNVYILLGSAQKIYRSQDKGATWTDITGNFPGGYNWSQSFYNYHIVCSTKTVNNVTSDVLYVGQIDFIQSQNADTVWRSIAQTYTGSAVAHNDQHGCAFNPSNPNEVFFSGDGGIFKTNYNPSNGSFTVSRLSKDVNVVTFYSGDWHPTDPNRMIGGTQDNATPVVYNSDIANWENVGGGDGCGCGINPSNPNIQYASSQFLGIYRTSNNWSSSSDISPNVGNDRTPFIGMLYVDPNSPHNAFVGTNYLWRYNNNSNNWTGRLGNTVLSPGDVVRSMAIPVGDSNFIVCGTGDGRVWYSTNAGTNWTQINTGSPGLPNRYVSAVNINPANKLDVIVTLGGTGSGHVYRCMDISAATRVWQNLSGSGATALPDISANCFARDLTDPQNTWYVGTDIGVFVTFDAGQTWANASGPNGLPNVRVDAMKAIAGTGFLNIATYGRGMWRIPLSATFTFGIMPDSYTVGSPGVEVGANNVTKIRVDDSVRAEATNTAVANSNLPSIKYAVLFTSPKKTNITALTAKVDAQTQYPGIEQRIEFVSRTNSNTVYQKDLFTFGTGNQDVTRTAALTNATELADVLDPATGKFEVRVRYRKVGVLPTAKFAGRVDFVEVDVSGNN